MKSYQSFAVAWTFFSLSLISLILYARRDARTRVQVHLYSAPWLIILGAFFAYGALYLYTLNSLTQFSTQRDALVPGAGLAENIQRFMSYEQGMIALNYTCLFVIRWERIWLLQRVNGVTDTTMNIALRVNIMVTIPGVLLATLSFYIINACRHDGKGKHFSLIGKR